MVIEDFSDENIFVLLFFFDSLHKLSKMAARIYPRANGAKRRSGRKPGVWVTNRAIAKSKVGSSRKGGHYVIFSEVVVERKKHYKNMANY